MNNKSNNNRKKDNKTKQEFIGSEISNKAEKREKSEKVEKKVYELKGEMSLGEADTLVASLWYGLNYGSIISGFALYKVLESLGRKPIFLNKPADMWTTHYDNPDSIAGRFIYRNCNVANREISLDELNKANCFVAGSDAIWSHDICGMQAERYFSGGQVKREMWRISCCSSFGENRNQKSEDEVEQYRNLNRFSAISVRNSTDSAYCKENLGICPEIILDPVFLCEKDEYEDVIKTAHFTKEEPYIFTYVENGNERIRHFIEKGMKIRSQKSVNYIDINQFPESVAKLGMEPEFHVMMEDWLKAVFGSEYVITDNYYGVCFAIIFHKPFVVFKSPDYRVANEMEELLKMLELEERIVPYDVGTDMKEYEWLFRKGINYDRVEDRHLSTLKAGTLQWMKASLVEE